MFNALHIGDQPCPSTPDKQKSEWCFNVGSPSTTLDQHRINIRSTPSVSYYTAMQRQKAVSAYFTSKQILPFAFAEQYMSFMAQLEK